MRFILDVRLMGIKDPVIWRKVAVPTKLSFHHLHLMLQAAMGWENSHLYSFQERIESQYFSVVSPYVQDMGINAVKVPAEKILGSYISQFHMDKTKPRDKIYYQYDFGDYWLHEIDVVDVDTSDRTSAELLDGGGACPPENCGGIPGFQMLKDCINGRMSKKEYFENFFAVDLEGYDVNALDHHHMRARVKGWKLMER